jgi:hypothetical protein
MKYFVVLKNYIGLLAGIEPGMRPAIPVERSDWWVPTFSFPAGVNTIAKS